MEAQKMGAHIIYEELWKVTRQFFKLSLVDKSSPYGIRNRKILHHYSMRVIKNFYSYTGKSTRHKFCENIWNLKSRVGVLELVGSQSWPNILLHITYGGKLAISFHTAVNGHSGVAFPKKRIGWYMLTVKIYIHVHNSTWNLLQSQCDS